MDLTNFSNNQYECGFDFYPELPNGYISKSHIKIRSVKSDAAVKFMSSLTKKSQINEFNAARNGKANLSKLEDAIQVDIDYASTLIIDFGEFSCDGKPIADAVELVTKFDWIRKQVIEQAKVDDGFFGK